MSMDKIFETYPYLYGVHQPGGVPPSGVASIMIDTETKKGRGWIIFTAVMTTSTPEKLGKDDDTNEDFSTWEDKGFGVIVRLNHGYGEQGTLPYADEGNANDTTAFVNWVGQFVAASKGAHIWIIGNEMNFPWEWPRYRNEPVPGDPSKQRPRVQIITAERYADAFKRCRSKIRSIGGHERDLVLMGGVGPWNTGELKALYYNDGELTKGQDSPYYSYRDSTEKLGDWVYYHQGILEKIGEGNLDGIAIHTYSRGNKPGAVSSDAKMDDYLPARFNGFITYREFMASHPGWAKKLPVFITETNHDFYYRYVDGKPVETKGWENKNSGFIKDAYGEIDEWNNTLGNQQIRALCLYRWYDNPAAPDPYNFGDDAEVKKEFQAELLNNRRVFAHPAFQYRWTVIDRSKSSSRFGWLWGPGPITHGLWEEYKQSSGGRRLVQYCDKARMELNDPNKDIKDPWGVTTGLLVNELVSGQIKTGDGENEFQPSSPAKIPVGADDIPSNTAHYAQFTNLADKVPKREGQVVQQIDASGSVLDTGVPSDYTSSADVKLAAYVMSGDDYASSVYAHNVPQVFHQYLSDIEDFLKTDKLPGLTWLFLMGYPIREPYWVYIPLGGKLTWIMVQLFQRRLLTFNPSQTDAKWRVEMGNVGLHYLKWRYGDAAFDLRPSNAAQRTASTAPSTTSAQVAPGATQRMNVTMQNIGTQAWAGAGDATEASQGETQPLAGGETARPYRLEAVNSEVQHIWNVTAVPVQGTVPVGSTASFDVEFTAPLAPGRYPFQLRMTQVDGGVWSGEYFTEPMDIEVVGDVSAINDAQFVDHSAPASLEPGEQAEVSVTLRNTGTRTWSSGGENPHRLGSQSPQDNTIWGLGRVELPHDVPPESTVTFTFRITAPDTHGIYVFQWQMVQELVEWFGEPSPAISIQVGRGIVDDFSFGTRGHFEAVTPMAAGGLGHYWRDNDSINKVWHGPRVFHDWVFNAVSLIQSTFGACGNLEVVATTNDGMIHFFRDSEPDFAWHETVTFGSGVSGNPALIQRRTADGHHGNFEVVVPQASGGIARYWRDNSVPEQPWNGPEVFALSEGLIDAVSLIESDFGDTPGSLEVVARIGDRLAHFHRPPNEGTTWSDPVYFGEAVSGNPSLIQSRFGSQRNFEVVVPATDGGFQHYYRDNDVPGRPWTGPIRVGHELGLFVSSVSLIQSNFRTPGDFSVTDDITTPGNFEVLVRVEAGLTHWYRDSETWRAWHQTVSFASDDGLPSATGFNSYGGPYNLFPVVPMIQDQSHAGETEKGPIGPEAQRKIGTPS